MCRKNNENNKNIGISTAQTCAFEEKNKREKQARSSKQDKESKHNSKLEKTIKKEKRRGR